MPIYVQLAEILREQIKCGRYAPVAALLPEDGIGGMHGVGRNRRLIASFSHVGPLGARRAAP